MSTATLELPLALPSRIRPGLALRPLPLPRRRPRFNQYLITVDFEAPGGEESFAVGGAETLEDAIAVAREALPLGFDWEPVRWSPVHGD